VERGGGEAVEKGDGEVEKGMGSSGIMEMEVEMGMGMEMEITRDLLGQLSSAQLIPRSG